MRAHHLLLLSTVLVAPPAAATFAVPTSNSSALLEVGSPSLALGFALGQGILQPRMGLRYDLGVHTLRAISGLSLRSFDSGLFSGDVHAELGPLLALGGLPAAGVVGNAAYLLGLQLDPLLLQLGPRVELATVLEADDRWEVKASALLDASVGISGPRVGAWLFAEVGYALAAQGRGATTLRSGLVLRVPVDL